MYEYAGQSSVFHSVIPAQAGMTEQGGRHPIAPYTYVPRLDASGFRGYSGAMRVFTLLCALLLFPVMVSGMERHDFEAEARTMMSRPASAQALLDLCARALAGTDDPAYQASIYGFTSHALWLRGKPAEAEAAARQSLALDPGASGGYFFLSDALYGLRRYDDGYAACLHGAERLPENDRQRGRTRCRAEYLDRVAMPPERIAQAVKDGRLSKGREVLIRGRISDIEGDALVFTTRDRRLVCRLASGRDSPLLRPMTRDAEGKQSNPLGGLTVGELITLSGTLGPSDERLIYFERCAIVPH